MEDRGSILGGDREFLSSPSCPDGLQGPPSLLSSGCQGSYSGVKAAEAWSWPLTSI